MNKDDVNNFYYLSALWASIFLNAKALNRKFSTHEIFAFKLINSYHKNIPSNTLEQCSNNIMKAISAAYLFTQTNPMPRKLTELDFVYHLKSCAAVSDFASSVYIDKNNIAEYVSALTVKFLSDAFDGSISFATENKPWFARRTVTSLLVTAKNVVGNYGKTNIFGIHKSDKYYDIFIGDIENLLKSLIVEQKITLQSDPHTILSLMFSMCKEFFDVTPIIDKQMMHDISMSKTMVHSFFIENNANSAQIIRSINQKLLKQYS